MDKISLTKINFSIWRKKRRNSTLL